MISWLTQPTTPFIKKEKEKYLINYRYRGSNYSFWYNYVTAPICDLMIKYIVPEWLAPNVITSIALMFNIGPCLWLYYYYGHLYTGTISPMMCHVIGIFFQIYVTLDGLDGKQARKTGNSSPAGMLFDHFGDAITSAINCTLM